MLGETGCKEDTAQSNWQVFAVIHCIVTKAITERFCYNTVYFFEANFPATAIRLRNRPEFVWSVVAMGLPVSISKALRVSSNCCK